MRFLSVSVPLWFTFFGGSVLDRSPSSLRPAIATLIAFFAITFPLWCNAYLSPPDSACYFSIPRSLVLAGDLDFTDDYAAMEFHTNFFYLTETGRFSNDWPVGTGVIWTPVYTVAHGTAKLAHALGIAGPAHVQDGPPRIAGLPSPGTMGAYEPMLAPTGLSGIYKLAISLAMAAAAVGALTLAMTVAREFTTPHVAMLAAFATLLGTPIAFYTYCYAMMSHVVSMLAVAVVLWGWHRTRGNRTPRDWALLGLAAGVMAMVRPQDGAFLAVFIVEAILDRRAIDWRRWFVGTGIAAATALLAFTPQFIVWTVLYGNPLQLPKIEEMHWLRPALWETLFSEYHGLLSWSPVLALVPFGLVVLGRRDRTLAVALAVVIALQIYLNAANEIWWAGGSFGARRFVNCGLPIVVALAALFGAVRPIVIGPVAVLTAGFNLLLISKERAGELSLDHFVPWNGEFFLGVLMMLNPLRFFPAMMGDFAGFGWPTRLVLMAIGLASAAFVWRGSWKPAPRLCQALLASTCAWFAVGAPLLFLVAAAHTPRHTADEFPMKLYRDNRSLWNGYYEFGFYNLVKNRPEAALAAYEKAAAVLPEHPNAWRYIALLKLQYFGDPEGALEAAEKALTIDPHYGPPLDTMREAAGQLGDLHPERREELLGRLRKREEAAK